MKKKRSLSIGAKLVLQVFILMLITLSVSLAFILHITSSNSEADATAQVEALAEADSETIKGLLENVLSQARTLAQSMQGYQDLAPESRRWTYNSMMKQVLTANPQYLGVWSCWEPNALDNMDAQYANTYGSDATGRFISYWESANGNIVLTALKDYTTAGVGDYYLLAKNSGKETILEPFQYEIDGKALWMTSLVVPIKASNGNTLGVVGIDISLDELQSIEFDKGQYSSTYAYALSNSGICVYHHNTDILGWNVKDVDKHEKMDEILAAVKQGEHYSYYSKSATTEEPVRRTVVPITIGDTETPWSLTVSIEEQEVMASTKQVSTMLIIIIIVLILAITVFLIIIIRISITNRIKKITHAAEEIANGNFDVELTVTSEDELGKLARAFKRTIDQLVNYQGYIDEVSGALSSVSNGDLTVVPQRDYVGQFKKLKDNMQALLQKLNDTMSEINQSADQVASGSDQVASGAQALSQGATEQASSIQELSATITEVTQQIRENADHAKLANDKAKSAGSEINLSNTQMKRMVSAMDDINGKSAEISKIIKVIEDIAFQTNILALNAAVEAARAGSAGKGFAVVADEVRNLASKSADAAKNTTALIEETLVAVQEGTEIATETAQSLEESERVTQEAVTLIDRITEASERQAVATAQINTGVEQIAAVVQTNSATAEESAAASEELSSQSSLLKQLVGQFKLRSMQQDSVATADEYSME